MKIMLSLSDRVYKALKPVDDKWIAKVNCTVKIGASTMRVNTIEDKREEAERRKRKRAYLRSAKHKDYDSIVELADIFARKFLGRNTYGLTSRSPHFSHFIIALKQIRHHAEALDISEREMRRYFFDALKNEFTSFGKAVKAGNLSSDTTWKLIVPQFLKEIIPSRKLRRLERRKIENHG